MAQTSKIKFLKDIFDSRDSAYVTANEINSIIDGLRAVHPDLFINNIREVDTITSNLVTNKLIKTAIIPFGVTSIGESAFANCTNLTDVVIPASVTSIGEKAFYGCNSLASIEIPDGVTSIGIGAFYGCKKLENILYSGTTSSWYTGIGKHSNDLCDITDDISRSWLVDLVGKSVICTDGTIQITCSHSKITVDYDNPTVHGRYCDGCKTWIIPEGDHEFGGGEHYGIYCTRTCVVCGYHVSEPYDWDFQSSDSGCGNYCTVCGAESSWQFHDPASASATSCKDVNYGTYEHVACCDICGYEYGEPQVYYSYDGLAWHYVKCCICDKELKQDGHGNIYTDGGIKYCGYCGGEVY